MRMLAIILVPVLALILGAAAPKVWAGDDPPVCWWNIEFNASDLDLGVRGFFDYEPWKELEIENPRGRTIAEVEGKKSMKRQAFAEWFFESGEPTLFEVSFDEFLRRFPVGYYEFEAETINGHEVECEEELTHVIPCAPDIDVCQKDGNTFIIWDPVETVVDTEATGEAVELEPDPDNFEAEDILACTYDQSLEIIGYEVIVEVEFEDSEKIFKVDLPAGEYSVMIPPEFLALGDEFQYEVLAIEISGNQTITEEEFSLDGGEQLEECPEEG
jgi:hypothetical protein